MIYRLRKKFIRICMCSFLAVFIVLFSAIFTLTSLQTTHALDDLANIIAENDGRFPGYDSLAQGPAGPPVGITRESPFTTRFFTVRFDADGAVTTVDARAIASIESEDAATLAEAALADGDTRGWSDGFRYLLTESDDGGTLAIFVSADGELAATNRLLYAVAAVFAGGSLIVLLLVTLLSKRAVRPVAESVERQQQFITDASHELKTPLTLIRTNLDIIEDEQGPSPWLDDIRSETASMTQLVNHLVALTRMNERAGSAAFEPVDLSALTAETTEAFAALAEQSGLTLSSEIAPAVRVNGDARALAQLLAILLDNACKYCDDGGAIRLQLSGGKHPLLELANSYAAVGTLATDRLFDRFYRADPARTQGSGFGLGLSIAKAICERHHAQISAQAADDRTILFRVRF